MYVVLSYSVYCAAQFVCVLSPAMSQVWLWYDEHMTLKHLDFAVSLFSTSLWSDESLYRETSSCLELPHTVSNRTCQNNVCISLGYGLILFALIIKSHDALWCTKPYLYMPFVRRHTFIQNIFPHIPVALPIRTRPLHGPWTSTSAPPVWETACSVNSEGLSISHALNSLTDDKQYGQKNHTVLVSIIWKAHSAVSTSRPQV